MSDLHLEAISHAFGDNQVLSGVSVNVAAGELVCLLGPSGCGKTTLLRLAAGLEPLQKGQIKINDVLVADGTNSNQMPPEQRGAGLMFQDFALFPHLNVRDNITFGIDAKNKTRRVEWVDHALTSMGLVGYADAYPHTLSGGQQQRVALIRAL
ncbi:MAG: ABC transporter ATP-binding protein, partial [Rhodospirillales bacterium]